MMKPSPLSLHPLAAPALSEVLETSNFPKYVVDAIKMLVNAKKVHTVEDILLLPSQEMKSTGLNPQQLQIFLSLLSGIIMDQSHSTLSTCMSLAQNYENHARLSFGHPVIDMFLNGGILPTGITEIVGESSSGKTQLCLQLLLQVQLPVHLGGLAGHAVYLTTESELNTKRLNQMIQYYKDVKFKDNPEVKNIEFFEHIFSDKAPNIDKLWEVISSRIGQLLYMKHIKLIVIDSIAALFRSEYSRDETMERSKVLWTFANQLKYISERYRVAIVVTNQVTSFFERDEHQLQRIPAHQIAQQQHTHSFMSSTQSSSSQKLIPSLGLAWSNCINTRLVLSRTVREYDYEINYPEKYMVKEGISRLQEYIDTNYEKYKNVNVFGENVASAEPQPKRMKTPGFIDQEAPEGQKNKVRKLQIGLSPTLPNLTCYLLIEKQGIRGLYCDYSPPSLVWTPQPVDQNGSENYENQNNENYNHQNNENNDQTQYYPNENDQGQFYETQNNENIGNENNETQYQTSECGDSETQFQNKEYESEYGNEATQNSCNLDSTNIINS
eukprot:TRINITY_DN4256_c0_g1_i1.p1 TRINITY_DN4256_c0_g1~~TRINITY_DN4256_c0_g1_i1.p1  ORF type:complete len:553 (-),score=91.06 TRINITY_DN4256_c0_g1_i1:287-1945(-)